MGLSQYAVMFACCMPEQLLRMNRDLVFPAGCGAVIAPQPSPARLTGFRHHLVEHRRAGKLLPARLGHDAPELIGAVRGPEVRLRLPVRDVHPPVLSVGGNGPVQPQGDEPRLGGEVLGCPGPQLVECLVPAGRTAKLFISVIGPVRT